MSLTLGLLGGGAKAAPLVVNTSVGSQDPGNANIVVTLPTGGVAGDLYAIFVECAANNANGTPPSGFTELVDNTGPSPTCWIYCTYKFAVGGEGPTVTVVFNTSAKTNWICYLIRGADSLTPPQVSAVANASSANNPNPPSLTPSWGAALNLWIVALMFTDGSKTVTTWPTGYDDNRLTRVGAAAADGSMNVASRALDAASDDPAAFALTGSTSCRFFTMAVKA
jgi:hypothetical protein